MTDDQAVVAFIAAVDKDPEYDRELQHRNGDEFISEVLQQAGFPKLASVYNTARKSWWFA